VQAARENARRTQCTNNMKQIGIAIHSFESSKGTFPAAYTLLNAADQDSNAQFAGPRKGLSLLATMLPYMDLDILYRLLDPTKSEFDTFNIPPSTSSSGVHAGANVAYATIVKSYLCPTDPTPSTLDYYNACWGPYGNGGGATCFPGGGTGANVVPAPGQVWARSDYFPIAGIQDALIATLGLTATYPTSIQMAGVINDPLLPGGGPVKAAQVTDGLSNTIVMSECGGKPVGYNSKRLVYISEVDGLKVDGSIEPVSSGGGAWGDMFIYSALAGGRCDGSGWRNGPCMINATSNNEIYSWHNGGANVLVGDGSVRFLSDDTSALIIVALVTRNSRENFQLP
jgi:hypothetical protein